MGVRSLDEEYFKSKPKTVVGLGYGDEGKGMTVAVLAREIRGAGGSPVVVRWNGGPQAAHNVRVTRPDGRQIHHTFSQFGAGTLEGAETVLSSKTLFQPYSAMREAAALMSETGESPLHLLTVDPAAPLLLPVHAQCNQALETARAAKGKRHGSTGMGVGVARDYELAMREAGEQDAIPVAADLAKPFRLADKMLEQARWLEARWGMDFHYSRQAAEDQATELHLIYSDMTAGGVAFRPAVEALSESRWTPGDVVFEGSQGVLLDLRYGFFPHVTYGWMTPDAAADLAAAADLPEPVVVGCTRSYSTRHGHGPFPPEGTYPEAASWDDNATGAWQGAFRTGLLDLPTLEYGASLVKPDVLSVSCLDKYPGRAITSWMGADGETLDPGRFALSADDGVRRRDDDAEFDPESVYAPLTAAEPHVETLSEEALLESITTACGAPVRIEGRGSDVGDWTVGL